MATKKTGRPSSYRPEYTRQAKQLCLLGATDKEIAAAFGVDVKTINNWKSAHPEFLQSLKEGKDLADARVADRLYQRALGYKHRAVKIVADAKTGAEHIVPYTEHYPPDTTAAIFWLKNRRPDLWRDKREVSVTQVDFSQLSDEQVARIAAGEDPAVVLSTITATPA